MPGVTLGASNDDLDVLLAEQIDFYRVDAEPFDRWLSTLLDERNDEPAARTYRQARRHIATLLERWAPLGRVLEIAAGTGRLAPLYLPHANTAVLLDASCESLAVAATNLAATNLAATNPKPRLVNEDIFDWDSDGERFDTVIFTAWLHHIPHPRFEQFWHNVDTLLTSGGRVLFDFPDVHLPASGAVDIPEQPSDGYSFYAPVDGISIRDHFGRRWRVVHNLWDPEHLTSWLAELGWTMTVLSPGLFGNVRWASAHR